MAGWETLQSTALALVKAVNGLAQTYLNVQGAQNLAGISTPTLVSGVGGRVAQVSVTTAGSGPGVIYDSSLVTSLMRPIYAIPEAVGIYLVNLPVGYGIVAAPGTDQVVTVSYS